MSHRDLVIRRTLRLIYAVLTILCYALVFVFVDNDFLACTFLILSFVFLPLFILTFRRYKKESPKLKPAIIKSINDHPKTLDEIKEMYKFLNLYYDDFKILKLFFNKDFSERCIIYKESNCVKFCLEELSFNTDTEKQWSLKFASWSPKTYSQSLYADAELAIKDNEHALEGFTEYPFNQDEKTFFSAEVVWKGINISSDLIPFGCFNTFNIIIDKKEIQNVEILNFNWSSLSNSFVQMLINSKHAPQKNKKFKFKILHNNLVIGKGSYFPQKN